MTQPNNSNNTPHIPKTAPEGTVGWRIGWFIEAADDQGMPIKTPGTMCWKQCMAVKGGKTNVQRTAKEVAAGLLRNVDALLDQGDLYELAGEDEARELTG